MEVHQPGGPTHMRPLRWPQGPRFITLPTLALPRSGVWGLSQSAHIYAPTPPVKERILGVNARPAYPWVVFTRL